MWVALTIFDSRVRGANIGVCKQTRDEKRTADTDNYDGNDKFWRIVCNVNVKKRLREKKKIPKNKEEVLNDTRRRPLAEAIIG